MADIGELVVRIKADAAQLERELKRIQGVTQQQAGKMQSALTPLKQAFKELLPAVSVGALALWARNAVQAADRMNDLGQRIGFAASTLSALETPLAQSGSSLEDFAASVNLMNANIGQAVTNIDGPAAQAFERLGISVAQLKSLSPEEQFYLIADALGKVGTQFEQTEIGRAIFGRGFASLIPLIKQADGDLKATVSTLGDLQNALSEDKLKAIDEFGDRWVAAAVRAKNEFLSLYAAIAQAAMATSDLIDRLAPKPGEVSVGATKVGRTPQQIEQAEREAYFNKARAGGFLTSTGTTYGEPFGPPASSKAAEIDRRFRAFQQQQSPSSVKQTTRETQELSAATEAFLARAERAKEIYEQTRTPLEVHNAKLAEAKQLFDAGLLTLDTYTRVQEELADGMGKTGDAAVLNARIVKDSFGDALESAMFDFENFGDAAGGILEGIGRKLARSKIIDPLSEAAGSLFDDILDGGGGGILSGIGSFLGFAEGGRPPVGRPSIVGEKGPEIFVPNTAGTIIPNGGFGGSSVVVNQYISMSPGLQGTVEAEIRRAAPAIATMAKNEVFNSIQRGGAEARIVGKRN